MSKTDEEALHDCCARVADLLSRCNSLTLQVAHLEVEIEHCRAQRERAVGLLKRAGLAIATYEAECTSSINDDDLLDEIGAFVAGVRG